MNNFGATLKSLIAERGISQAELARRVGVSATAVTYWTSETVKPSPERVIRLEDELDVQPRGLLLELIGYAHSSQDSQPTVESLIRSDPGLSPEDKRVLLRVVALARDRFAREGWVDEEFRRRPGRRAATARRPAS